MAGATGAAAGAGAADDGVEVRGWTAGAGAGSLGDAATSVLSAAGAGSFKASVGSVDRPPKSPICIAPNATPPTTRSRRATRRTMSLTGRDSRTVDDVDFEAQGSATAGVAGFVGGTDVAAGEAGAAAIVAATSGAGADDGAVGGMVSDAGAAVAVFAPPPGGGVTRVASPAEADAIGPCVVA
jgi:hypothetical protein